MGKRTEEAMLWFGALGGPIAWALRLVIAYPMVPVACKAGSLAPLLLVSAGFAAASILSTSVAWVSLGRHTAGGDAKEQRRYVMARAGLWLGVLFTGVIGAESAAIFFIDPCIDVELETALPWMLEAMARLLAGQFPNAALAHVIFPIPTPADAFSTWSFDPFVLLALVFAASAYLRGVLRAWRRSGVGRGVSRLQAFAFLLALAGLTAALISPIDTVGGLLFSGHMVQHLLLVSLAAPLFVLGVPWRAVAWNVPARLLRRGTRAVKALRAWPLTVRIVRAGTTVFLLHLLAMWAWHVPLLYEAALQNELVHALEHASFFGSSVLLFGFVRRAAGAPRSAAGPAILVVFLTAATTGVLGALMTFSPSPWYPPHAAGAEGWTISALEDQQLAGLLMWIPGSVSYLAAALWLTLKWVAASGGSGSAAPIAPPFPQQGGVGA